ncbi:Putative Mg2+ transporter protein, CorA-like/Zinc transport protein ZntB [Colletotrichum destructivum]|uniref:Mg2+ transporter protein, CorA-like/Zinc transport protein ZntB n=1 Tax=Colletotrichum destructivum TaxID=34406 RepID=A0AAX4I3I8_9PEZI|nr:Putative Mg2+ transporter protein, CorA-like/Zinc transport protein ZntB [Colletotrichum destructivum]
MSQYETTTWREEAAPPRRRGPSLFSSRTSAQNLRSQYTREAQTTHLVQLIEEFRKADPIYDPVPPTPPPRALGRQRSQRAVHTQPVVRFASPLDPLSARRRRAKTPLSAPVVYEVATQTPQTLQNLDFGVATVTPEEQEMRPRQPTPEGPVTVLVNNDEEGTDLQSFDLDGFPMPPDFGAREEYSFPGYDGDEWVDLEETTGKVYAFDPARLGADSSRTDDGFDLETPFSDDSTMRGEELPPSRALHVYRSRYTGDGVLGGTHSAVLDVVYDAKRKRQSLFRWLHVQQDMMNFDEFTSEISKALSEREQNDIRKLLSDVRKNYAKTVRTSRATTVKHMDPSYLQLPLQQGDQEKGAQAGKRTATWLCIPYFSLEEYSGIQATGNPGAFPPLTLLQLAFSRNSQKRDMLQATRQIGNGEKGSCFHIRQLWCIVLDNSLLITCGSMYEEALRGDNIAVTSEPGREPTPNSDNDGRILIRYGESVLWSFPLQECQTWFAFIAHFSDFWPKAVRFHFNGRLLSEARWWKVLQFAGTSRRSVVISMETCAPPQLPPSGILRTIKQGLSDTASQASGAGLQPPKPSSSGNRTSFPPVRPSVPNEMFHVFSWAAPNTPSSVDGPNFVVLQKQLSEVEDFLTAETNGPDQRAYLDAETSTRVEVFLYLEQLGAEMQSTKKAWKRQDYEERVDIFNAADSLFRFFLPPLFDGPTTEKFWGAVMSLVKLSLPEAADGESHPSNLDKTRRDAIYANAQTVKKALRQLALPVIACKSILSHAEPTDRLDIDVPQDLIVAWLHLVMGLIYASHETHMWEDHLDVADRLVKGGMKQMMERLSSLSLLERSSVLPLELVSLISYRLLANTSGKYAGITDTYSEYLRALENDIANGQSDMTYQQRINFLRQEVNVINRTIAAQSSVFNSILASRQEGQSAAPKQRRLNRGAFGEQVNNRDAVSLRSHLLLGRSRYGDDEETNVLLESMAEVSDFYKLPSTDAAGFRDLLAAECTQLLERRNRDFQEYGEQADVLEQTNLNNAAVTKDRQEQAIYAFTIVTIIFLPLSAVSSIFGMNSSDIRDMKDGQWLYWATAIPVTILTIVLGLWWMGEMGHLWDWAFRKIRGDETVGSEFPGHGGMSEKAHRHDAIEVLPAAQAVYSRPQSARQSFARRPDSRLGG